MVQSTDIMGLSARWIRIMNKLDAIEKCPKDFGSGDLLHCSQIHTIMAIGKNPEINITDLAVILGISKSAISQMISRLERENLVEKFRNPDNDKEVLLRLTPRGIIAYLGHEQYHAKVFARMQQNLGVITDEQFQFLQVFLRSIEETADEFIKENG